MEEKKAELTPTEKLHHNVALPMKHSATRSATGRITPLHCFICGAQAEAKNAALEVEGRIDRMMLQ